MAASTEPVVELVNRYRQEFETSFDGLRRRSVAFSESVQQQLQQAEALQPQVTQMGNDVVQALKELEPLADAKSTQVLETFAAAAVTQLTFRLTSIVGAYLLAPFVGLALDHSSAALLAYVLLPYLTYLKISQKDSDENNRFKLLAFAVAEGVLVGFLLANRYLATGQPLLTLSPLIVALSVQLLGASLAANRVQLHGVAIGGGVAVHLVLGLVAGQLSFPYLLLVLLNAGIGFATLQLFYKYAASPESNHLYALGYVYGTLLAQGLVFLLFGGPYEDMRSSEPPANDKSG